jgi:hypothetical protein
MAAINLNIKCKVKLTPFGEKALKDYYCDYLKTVRLSTESLFESLHKPDENGYMNFQLWEMFMIFGSKIHMGMSEVPFEDNNILFPLKELIECQPM